MSAADARPLAPSPSPPRERIATMTPTTAVVDVPVARTTVFSGAASLATYSSVAAPTLIVRGLLDVPSVVVNMRHAAATIPGARTLVIDDVAHLPNLEVPGRFDAALSAFLQHAVRG